MVLAQLNALMRALHVHTKCQARLPTRRLEEEFYDVSATSDDERNELNCQGSISTVDFICQLVCPGDVENYDDVALEYACFCPVALVSGQGFALPGNRRIGYLKFENKYYSPSTVDRAEQFGRNPMMFLSAITRLTTENPCLVSLLNIESGSEQEDGVVRKSNERSCQTATHAIEPYRDPEYRWSEWDMRQDAIRLSNTRKATAKGVQTDGSRGVKVKIPAAVQASPPTSTGVQTSKNEASTSTGQTRSYIIGLQGDTTFPVEHIIIDELACNT